MILAGPPGTGKTWVASALMLVGDETGERRYWPVVLVRRVYGYEEFTEGLHPVSRVTYHQPSTNSTESSP